MATKLTVVVSQGQSHNPAKRKLEEDLVAALLFEPGVEVTVVPNLYDLAPEGTGVLALQGIAGDMVVCSWLFSRAAHWTLDRNGIRGRIGETLLVAETDDEEEDEEEKAEEADGKHRVAEVRNLPRRKIYCLDFKVSNDVAAYVEEIRRIAAENSMETVDLLNWIVGSPTPQQRERFLHPAAGNVEHNGNGTDGGSVEGTQKREGDAPAEPGIADRRGGSAGASPSRAEGASPSRADSSENGQPAASSTHGDAPQPKVIGDEPGRRWYPVIDFSRCTNCLECIDFCLFGVYGVDQAETILVEQPDNCRKGCPACSRVCPENAIIFPQHKTPAIAGSNDAVGGLKIDLSKLFGAPDKDPIEIAAIERDEQLVMVGRDAVGLSVGIPKRQADRPKDEPPDELDALIDELDGMEL